MYSNELMQFDLEEVQLVLLGAFLLGLFLITAQSFLHRIRSHQSSVLRSKFEEESQQLLSS